MKRSHADNQQGSEIEQAVQNEEGDLGVNIRDNRNAAEIEFDDYNDYSQEYHVTGKEGKIGTVYDFEQTDERFLHQVGYGEIDTDERDGVEFLTNESRKLFKVFPRGGDGGGSPISDLSGKASPAATYAHYYLSRKGALYVAMGEGQDVKFCHSSLTGRRSVQSAGLLDWQDGAITRIDNESGHYKPSLEAFVCAVLALGAKGFVSPETKIEIVEQCQPNGKLSNLVNEGRLFQMRQFFSGVTAKDVMGDIIESMYDLPGMDSLAEEIDNVIARNWRGGCRMLWNWAKEQ